MLDNLPGTMCDDALSARLWGRVSVNDCGTRSGRGLLLTDLASTGKCVFASPFAYLGATLRHGLVRLCQQFACSPFEAISIPSEKCLDPSGDLRFASFFSKGPKMRFEQVGDDILHLSQRPEPGFRLFRVRRLKETRVEGESPGDVCVRVVRGQFASYDLPTMSLSESRCRATQVALCSPKGPPSQLLGTI